MVATGDYDQALTFHKRHLATAQRLDHQQSCLHALGNLGNVCTATSQYPQAADYYRQQLSRAQDSGDPLGVCLAQGNLGAVAIALGDYDETAAGYFDQAIALATELGMPLAEDC